MLKAETTPKSKIVLPAVPAEFANDAVAAWSQAVSIDSYLPDAPDSYPAFLDSRVYQGSSGRVFPLPFHERIDPVRRTHEWQAIHLENEWLRLMILPELGGRIHIAYDKIADYDIFYRNNVIKPALVGLAGPWISGGIEFNWPQHHRPGTFLPTDVSIEREEDGSITVWCSDHDPFARMKGMHGIRLRPGSSVIEARVRLFNRSEVTQTFLWWANVAAAVNDDYQSFFPTDVTHVADHARRAIATFPNVEGSYYGVDYPARVNDETPDADRLDWYRNIPVPTSYMVTATDDEFFGGYDHGRDAGFVHWANRDISPGKKQWTWGNAEFGRAWDANLTDDDGPYVELMAGVFTDNQPDFSYLGPGETKTFSQFWYPIHGVGPVQQASRCAAVSLRLSTSEPQVYEVRVAVNEVFPEVIVTVTDAEGVVLFENSGAANPGLPFVGGEFQIDAPGQTVESLTVTVRAGDLELVVLRPRLATEKPPVKPATEPPAAQEVQTVEELFLVGQYLDQYRHATRSPEPYWEEALRREPGDLRSNLALAARRYAAADYEASVNHLQTALARESAWVPTPADGEVHYRLGLALLRLGRGAEAERHLARSSWSQAWSVAANVALGRLHARAGSLEAAENRLRHAVESDPQHLQAADLLVRVLRALGREAEASAILMRTLELDPLDQWALDLAGRELTHDSPTLLDIAIEYATAGFVDDALRLLDVAEEHLAETAVGQVHVGPLIGYHRASILDSAGRAFDASQARVAARVGSARFALPSRLEDIAALHAALTADPTDARAAALLGHWYYDRNRRDLAVELWTQSLANRPDRETTAIVQRNLGIAAYNVTHDKVAARRYYEAALAAQPEDAKLWQEFDQLAARLGEPSAVRLARLAARPDIVAMRDDLTVSFARLLTAEGRAVEALTLIAGRQFQPWEGGEGEVIAAWDEANLARSADALIAGEAAQSLALLAQSLTLPPTLGEARHPLANRAQLDLAVGDSLAAAGDAERARAAWQAAATAEGDFSSMAPQSYSRQSIYSILALQRLGEREGASAMADKFARYLDEVASTPAQIDYFATSLPTMLLFVDDPSETRDREVTTLRGMLHQLADTVGVE